MRKDKRSLLKFALLPLSLLLLMFATGEGQIFGDYNQASSNTTSSQTPSTLINQVAILDTNCTEVFLDKTISTDPDGQLFLEPEETELYDITIPSGSNIYAIIEWDFHYCWGGLGVGNTGISIYNALYNPLNATFSAPYDNYGEGVTIMLLPGSWTLNITSRETTKYLCYELTIRIYGCSSGEAPVVVPKGP